VIVWEVPWEWTVEAVLEAEARERAQGWADPDELLRRAEIIASWELPELDYYHAARAIIAQGLDWRPARPGGRPAGSDLQDAADWAADYHREHGGKKAAAARKAAEQFPGIEGTPGQEPWQRIYKAMRR
jgi:hypothetical protein